MTFSFMLEPKVQVKQNVLQSQLFWNYADIARLDLVESIVTSAISAYV